VFVHGGGRAGGSPSFHIRHAHQFASRGWVAANVSYRLSGEAPWPACVEDVKCAIRWMRAHAGELGLDPERIAVVGGSAGGHLAAMVALTPDRPELEGTGGNPDQSSAVQAAAIWYPATDLRSFAATEARAMTDLLCPGLSGDDLLAASPLGNVSGGAPPILTMTGDADPVTTAVDIERFHAALTEVGARNELMVFAGRDHGFDFHPADWAVCFERMTAFLEEALEFEPTLAG
jgi:acetyl esterase/lipase